MPTSFEIAYKPIECVQVALPRLVSLSRSLPRSACAGPLARVPARTALYTGADKWVTFCSQPKVGVNGYDGFKPGETTLLKKGTTREGWDGERTKALESDILLEHDVALEMRDGATLYTDIYRPADATGPVPVLVMWSPYGKR